SERVLSVRPLRDVVSRPFYFRWWLLAVGTVAAACWLWFGMSSDALRPGAPERSFVAKRDELAVRLGDLIAITLQPNSELQFVHWRDGEQAKFRLIRGGLRAEVAPPPRVAPGFFVLETPHATVVDQGCSYELLIDDGGTTRVFVDAGIVTFADQERTVWVPAGARAVVDQAGVQTPVFVTATREVRKLVQLIDQLRQEG